jgi:hypothetical protein
MALADAELVGILTSPVEPVVVLMSVAVVVLAGYLATADAEEADPATVAAAGRGGNGAEALAAAGWAGLAGCPAEALAAAVAEVVFS